MKPSPLVLFQMIKDAIIKFCSLGHPSQGQGEEQTLDLFQFCVHLPRMGVQPYLRGDTTRCPDVISCYSPWQYYRLLKRLGSQT